MNIHARALPTVAYAVCDVIFLDHAESAVRPAESGEEPDDYGGEEDDGSGLLYETPASFPHASQDVGECGPVVSGKLHYERSRFSCEHLRLLEYDTGADDRCDSDEV